VEHFVAIANLFDTTHRPCHDMLLETLEALLESRPDTGHTTRLTLVRCVEFSRFSEPAMVRAVSSLASCRRLKKDKAQLLVQKRTYWDVVQSVFEALQFRTTLDELVLKAFVAEYQKKRPIMQVKPAFRDRRVASLLVNTLRETKDDPSEDGRCILVLQLMYLFGRVHANQIAIARVGGIQAVLDAMRSHASCVAVQHHGCKVIRNLAINDENQVIITREGGHIVVLDAMRQHAAHEEVGHHGCMALANIAYNSNNQVLITD